MDRKNRISRTVTHLPYKMALPDIHRGNNTDVSNSVSNREETPRPPAVLAERSGRI